MLRVFIGNVRQSDHKPAPTRATPPAPPTARPRVLPLAERERMISYIASNCEQKRSGQKYRYFDDLDFKALGSPTQQALLTELVNACSEEKSATHFFETRFEEWQKTLISLISELLFDESGRAIDPRIKSKLVFKGVSPSTADTGSAYIFKCFSFVCVQKTCFVSLEQLQAARQKTREAFCKTLYKKTKISREESKTRSPSSVSSRSNPPSPSRETKLSDVTLMRFHLGRM